MWVWSKLSGAKWEDAWEERFYGNPNVVISHFKDKPTIRIEVYGPSEAAALEIQEQFGGSIRKVKEQNWAALSPVQAPPLKIRDCLLITQESEKEKLAALQEDFPDRQLISIPPEMAFGTGDHATTSTVLRYLVDEARRREGQSWSCLDLGTGSGILAIGASLMGAVGGLALDYDPKSVEATLRNLKRAEVTQFEVVEANVLEWEAPAKYEVLFANLFSDVLRGSFPGMARWIKPGGTLIISGILKEQWSITREAAELAGFALAEEKAIGKWVSARLTWES